MITGGSTGSSTYVIPLLLLTGAFLLRMDVKKYIIMEMPKEGKTTLFLGWFNLVLGALLFVWVWVM
ncbi:CLC_0170 family protein [Brevibacillus brevis]|uniref:CLC_0170 family protein n=1 Tax=Brevibacillus brevis TaxID=1393 RepID=A0ABY9SYP8_BREBE|nr:CLC_0170 family protein [Brevibacillus brevis]WNC12952.1 CLC_0170 family protein [Brevibacillus brevis]